MLFSIILTTTLGEGLSYSCILVEEPKGTVFKMLTHGHTTSKGRKKIVSSGHLTPKSKLLNRMPPLLTV